MAERMLKDVIKCECGCEMFPYAIHEESDSILYKCSSEECDCAKELPLRKAVLGNSEMFTYFCLDDDGKIYWNCALHGKCESDLKWLASGWRSKVNKFINYGCGYELDLDEVMDDMDNREEHGEKLQELFAELDEEDIARIADVININTDGGYVDAFLDDFMNQIGDGHIYTWEDYVENITDVMKNLDLIDLEEDENED